MLRGLLIVLFWCLSLQIGAAQEPAAVADGAILRVLDRVTGQASDLPVKSGDQKTVGSLNIRLDECRFPIDNPVGDAYAHLTISQANAMIFSGWMIASSPALNALEHSRYDVWVLRCAMADASTE